MHMRRSVCPCLTSRLLLISAGTDMGGRVVFEVERVAVGEVGVDLAPEIFTLPPSPASARRK